MTLPAPPDSPPVKLSCDCCGHAFEIPADDRQAFPRCPECDWPCDRPKAIGSQPGARELRARQVVLAQGTLDAWQAKFAAYHTTIDSCDCPDHQIRGRQVGPCKHMLALRLLKAREAAA